jgi:hypothetical protein
MMLRDDANISISCHELNISPSLIHFKSVKTKNMIAQKKKIIRECCLFQMLNEKENMYLHVFVLFQTFDIPCARCFT